MAREPGYSREPIRLGVGRRSYSVPFRPAAEWVEAVAAAEGGPAGVLLAVVDQPTQSEIYESLLTGSLSSEELAQAAYDVLSEASPFKWWETCRLLYASRQRQVMGRLALAGLDPWSMPVGVWCTAVYACMTENADDVGKFKFDAQLNNPPDGVEDDDWGDDFETMVAQARQMPGMK